MAGGIFAKDGSLRVTGHTKLEKNRRWTRMGVPCRFRVFYLKAKTLHRCGGRLGCRRNLVAFLCLFAGIVVLRPGPGNTVNSQRTGFQWYSRRVQYPFKSTSPVCSCNLIPRISKY